MKLIGMALIVGTLAAACGGQSASPSSGSSSGGIPGPGDMPPGGNPVTCDASAAADIEVSSDDLNGFPPYAVAACTLAYVNRSGELVTRNLAAGPGVVETVIAPATEHPRRPTASPGLIAWEADDHSHSVVRVFKDGLAKTIPGSFASAGEPRASGTVVAFTGWNGPSAADDTDVWLYDATSGDAHVVLGGPGQQRFADVSSAFVAASDFSEDPDGRYDNDGKDLADIIVFDRTTRAVTTRRSPGKQAFPMLADNGVLAYLAWNGIHPEPKFVDYELRTGKVLADPAADTRIAQVIYASSDYARPAVIGGTIEWIANPDGNTTLYRAPADGSSPPAAVKGLESFHLYAPAALNGASGFTVLATSRVGSTEIVPRLRAVPR